MSERDIVNPLLVAASALGSRLFRQNTGRGWVGTLLRRDGNTVTLQAPRVFHAGLCVGSSDIIGFHSREITPDMVGQRVAVFVAFEVKTRNVRLTREQRAFLDAVTAAGGIAAEVRSVEQGVSLLETKRPAGG